MFWVLHWAKFFSLWRSITITKEHTQAGRMTLNSVQAGKLRTCMYWISYHKIMFAVYMNTQADSSSCWSSLEVDAMYSSSDKINVSLGDGVISLFFSHHPSMSTQRNRDFDYANILMYTRWSMCSSHKYSVFILSPDCNHCQYSVLVRKTLITDGETSGEQLGARQLGNTLAQYRSGGCHFLWVCSSCFLTVLYQLCTLKGYRM